MSTFPSVITSFSNPTPTDRLNSPSHSSVETAQNTGINAVENFVGTLSSAQGTLMYDVRATASDGGGHVQTALKGGTGQVTYTKGDILVAQNSSTLTKVAVGADDNVIVADSSKNVGVKWGAVPTFNVQSFVSPGMSTWSKPGGVTAASKVFVQLWGGGLFVRTGVCAFGRGTKQRPVPAFAPLQ